MAPGLARNVVALAALGDFLAFIIGFRVCIGGSGKTCLAYDKTKGLLGRLP